MILCALSAKPRTGGGPEPCYSRCCCASRKCCQQRCSRWVPPPGQGFGCPLGGRSSQWWLSWLVFPTLATAMPQSGPFMLEQYAELVAKRPRSCDRCWLPGDECPRGLIDLTVMTRWALASARSPLSFTLYPGAVAVQAGVMVDLDFGGGTFGSPTTVAAGVRQRRPRRTDGPLARRTIGLTGTQWTTRRTADATRGGELGRFDPERSAARQW